jgi:hypothetical protein
MCIGVIFLLAATATTTKNMNPLVPQTFVLNFSMKALEKLSLCEKIPHEKSYLDILIGNQDINDIRFLIFLRVHSYDFW